MSHDDNKRKVVHAAICTPAAESLRAFCVSHGVTLTAFLDGLGHMLCPHRDDALPDLEKALPAVAAALMLARRIDAGRRSREPYASSSGSEPATAAGQ